MQFQLQLQLARGARFERQRQRLLSSIHQFLFHERLGARPVKPPVPQRDRQTGWPGPAHAALERGLQPHQLRLHKNQVARLNHQAGRPRGHLELQAARLTEVFEPGDALHRRRRFGGNIDSARAGIFGPFQRPVAIDREIDHSPLPHRAEHFKPRRLQRSSGWFSAGGERRQQTDFGDPAAGAVELHFHLLRLLSPRGGHGRDGIACGIGRHPFHPDGQADAEHLHRAAEAADLQAGVAADAVAAFDANDNFAARIQELPGFAAHTQGGLPGQLQIAAGTNHFHFALAAAR